MFIIFWKKLIIAWVLSRVIRIIHCLRSLTILAVLPLSICVCLKLPCRGTSCTVYRFGSMLNTSLELSALYNYVFLGDDTERISAPFCFGIHWQLYNFFLALYVLHSVPPYHTCICALLLALKGCNLANRFFSSKESKFPVAGSFWGGSVLLCCLSLYYRRETWLVSVES